MAVVLIIAILAMSSIPLLQGQLAVREIETIARRFIGHAQFTRQQALYLGQSVQMTPLEGNNWDSGWSVTSAGNKPEISKHWLTQGAIDPIYFKDGGKQFSDPHSSKKGIRFNGAGAAKTGSGGFVANRLILGHRLKPELERHLILSSGGRWRICDPRVDNRVCR